MPAGAAPPALLDCGWCWYRDDGEEDEVDLFVVAEEFGFGDVEAEVEVEVDADGDEDFTFACGVFGVNRVASATLRGILPSPAIVFLPACLTFSYFCSTFGFGGVDRSIG